MSELTEVRSMVASWCICAYASACRHSVLYGGHSTWKTADDRGRDAISREPL